MSSKQPSLCNAAKAPPGPWGLKNTLPGSVSKTFPVRGHRTLRENIKVFWCKSESIVLFQKGHLFCMGGQACHQTQWNTDTIFSRYRSNLFKVKLVQRTLRNGPDRTHALGAIKSQTASVGNSAFATNVSRSVCYAAPLNSLANASKSTSAI